MRSPVVVAAQRFGWAPGLLSRIADGDVDLRNAVDVLSSVDPCALDGEERVDLLRAWERVAAMVAGAEQVAMASVVGATEALGLSGEDARHEVGAALRLAPTTAAARTRVAADLQERRPATLSALCRGDLCYQQAAVIAAGVRPLPDELAAAVEGRVLRGAPEQTIAETRRAVLRAILAADPEGADDRHQKAVRERKIDRMPMADAMESWWFALPAHAAADLWTRVSQEARQRQKALLAAGLEDPGIDALRLDCLVDAALGKGAAARYYGGSRAATLTGDFDRATCDDADTAAELSDAEAASGVLTGPLADRVREPGSLAADALAGLPRCSCGGRQVAAVVVDLPTLLGLADRPGEIPGHGPVPGSMARTMAADRDWVRWTVDPGTRQVIDRSKGSYRPSEDMRAFLAARDRVCGFPGCNRRAQDCDCDHVVNFGLADGTTVAVNLGPLCRQHHNAKTHGRWRLTYDPVRRLRTWTSPLGKTYVTGTDPPLA